MRFLFVFFFVVFFCVFFLPEVFSMSLLHVCEQQRFWRDRVYSGHNPASILYKSIAGRYRPVRVADGPITARYRFIKNASWEVPFSHVLAQLLYM